MTLPRAAHSGLLVSALVRRDPLLHHLGGGTDEANLWLWPDGTDRDPVVLPGPRRTAELPEPR